MNQLDTNWRHVSRDKYSEFKLTRIGHFFAFLGMDFYTTEMILKPRKRWVHCTATLQWKEDVSKWNTTLRWCKEFDKNPDPTQTQATDPPSATTEMKSPKAEKGKFKWKGSGAAVSAQFKANLARRKKKLLLAKDRARQAKEGEGDQGAKDDQKKRRVLQTMI